jgi:carboxylesterase
LARRGGIEHGKEFELEGGPDAVLLLHGLTGSTFELFPVAARLHAAGMRCLAPLMAGHGGSAADLAPVPWTEWVARAGRDLARLDGARRAFLVGCSMGALVACALAQERPERVHGLVLLAPALELNVAGRLGALLGRVPFVRGMSLRKRGGSDVNDPEMRRRNPCLDAVPLAAVAELARLERHVERLLPSVTAPALVIHGRDDHTVTEAGARRLAARIGSGPAAFVLLERSAHLVGIDVERDRCAQAAAEFLEAIPLRGSGRAPAGSSGQR